MRHDLSFTPNPFLVFVLCWARAGRPCHVHGGRIGGAYDPGRERTRNMGYEISLMLLGGGIGIASGILGIGGGVLVVPMLVLLFHFTQRKAVGTSLAMLLPPIGIFAVIEYWRSNHIDLKAAGLLAIGFALGAWAGGWFVTHVRIPDRTLRLIFVAFMLYVAGNMLFRGERRVWAVLSTLGLMTIFGLAYIVLRMVGKRWEREFVIGDEYRRRLESPVVPDYEI